MFILKVPKDTVPDVVIDHGAGKGGNWSFSCVQYYTDDLIAFFHGTVISAAEYEAETAAGRGVMS